MTKLLLIIPLFLLSCQRSNFRKSTLGEFLGEPSAHTTEQQVLIMGLQNPEEFKAQARAHGLKVSGSTVVQLSGDTSVIRDLQAEGSLSVLSNQTFTMESSENPGNRERFEAPDSQVYYLAKKDFGLPDFWKEHPEWDGRGVIVGVIDDGVSPLAEGLLKTSDGKKKLIHRHWTSHLLDLKLTETLRSDERNRYAKSWEKPFETMWSGILKEGELNPLSDGFMDLNDDGTRSEIDVVLVQTNSKKLVCLDVNLNHAIDAKECFGFFDETGEYGYWTKDHLVSVEANPGLQAGEIRLSYGERTDSHGEGVSSVFVGHKIGDKFDGVAPGAQLIDVDFSSPSFDFDQGFYNMGSFIEALEWLGQKRVEVINISYGFYFESIKAQEFMKKALKELVKKYNFVISFSAGNNGPGLGSLNRQSIYPENVLVAGAFVSRDLDEYVHGVSGLPDPGRVVSYSSRGPGPSRGKGPMVISPLASLTHSVANEGFGAFSGTSSASPALAGLAAVLISAVKQKNLRVDASAVVHAIRMSGLSLEGTSFVDQGYGLPKITKALLIYERLVQGEQFVSVNAMVRGQPSYGSDLPNGILIKTSELRNNPEYFISLEGQLAQLVPKEKGSNLLKELSLTYSANWILGPKRLWLSVGASNMTIGIDRNSLLSAISFPGQELLEEIDFFDSQTGEKLHAIPVSIIDDRPLEESLKLNLSLEAEQGKRIHMNISTDTRGLSVKMKHRQGYQPLGSVAIYNPSGVRVMRSSENSLFVPTPSWGWHQVAFARSYGTALPMLIDAEVTPLKLNLSSSAVSLTKPSIEIDNLASLQELKVNLVEASKLLTRKVLATNGTGQISIESAALEPGEYRIDLNLAHTSEYSYMRASCVAKLFSKEKNLLEMDSTDSFIVTEKRKGGSIQFTCRPFSYIGEGSSEETVFLAQIFWRPEGTAKIFASRTLELKPGRNSVGLKWDIAPAEGLNLDVQILPIVGTGTVKLGELITY